MKETTIRERVEVPGARPATFKLVPQAASSFDLYRSNRKIGTAERAGKDKWSAVFKVPGARFGANARSASELLQFVGAYVLTLAARKEAERPVEETHPELRVKGRMTAEKISIAFVRKARDSRRRQIERQLDAVRKKLERVPKG